MFNVCPACGAYEVEKAIEPGGAAAAFAGCPRCGHRQRFLRLPLFVVTGASGAGKSALALALPARLPECVTLESDILWGAGFDTTEDGYAAFRGLWLRLAKNVHQAGRPVVLCGSALPEQFEGRPERRYLAAIRYLALVCDERRLAERLRRRPAWRESGGDAFVAEMVRFNGWLGDHAARTSPPMDLLDTSELSVEEATERVAAWVRGGLDPR